MRRHAHYGLKASPGSFSGYLPLELGASDQLQPEEVAECADFAAEHGVLLACDGTEHHDSGWYSDEQGFQVLLIANHRTGAWRVAEEWHCASQNAIISPAPDDVWFRATPRNHRNIGRIVKYGPRVAKTLHEARRAGLLSEKGESGGMGVAGVPWGNARSRVLACSRLEVLESHLTCLSESSGYVREAKAAKFLQENRDLSDEEASATVLSRAMRTAKAQAMRKTAIAFKQTAREQASYSTNWPNAFEKLFVQRDFHLSKCVFTSKDKEQLLAGEQKRTQEITHKIEDVVARLRPAAVAKPIYGLAAPQLKCDMDTHSEPKRIESLVGASTAS